RRVPIGPVPGAPAQAAATTVVPERLPGLDRLLEAALRDDAAAIRRFSLDLLDGPAGQAWLAEGEARLQGRGWLPEDATQRRPAGREPRRGRGGARRGRRALRAPNARCRSSRGARTGRAGSGP